MLKKRNFLNKILNLNALHQAIALFFILFTFLDISLFGYCSEELPCSTSLSKIETGVISPSNDLVNSTTLYQRQKKHEQTPYNTDEDTCFCCAHLILTQKLLIDKIEAVLALEKPNKPSLPESPPYNTYHPPRSI